MKKPLGRAKKRTEVFAWQSSGFSLTELCLPLLESSGYSAEQRIFFRKTPEASLA